MLGKLLTSRSTLAHDVAMEHAIIEPELRYIMVQPGALTMVLRDGRSITLSAPGAVMTYHTPPPVQMQERKIRQVDVRTFSTGNDVIILNLGVEVILNVTNEVNPGQSLEWTLSFEGDDQLRRRLTNRFLMNGKRWHVPTLLTYRPWRTYDVDSKSYQPALSEEPEGEAARAETPSR